MPTKRIKRDASKDLSVVLERIAALEMLRQSLRMQGRQGSAAGISAQIADEIQALILRGKWTQLILMARTREMALLPDLDRKQQAEAETKDTSQAKKRKSDLDW